MKWLVAGVLVLVGIYFVAYTADKGQLIGAGILLFAGGILYASEGSNHRQSR